MNLRSALFLLGLLGCGADSSPQFIEAPELTVDATSVVYAYLGSESLTILAGAALDSFVSPEPDDDGDRVQALEEREDLVTLGLEVGLVQLPTDPCRRACALSGPRVQEMQRVAGAWSEWEATTMDDQVLEVLLPAAQRGRCQACRSFEQTHVDLGTVTPPRFLLTDPARSDAIMGLLDGRVAAVDAEGHFEMLCQLEDGRFHAGALMSSGRLVVGGREGRLDIVDLSAGCATLTSTQSTSNDLISHLAVHPTTLEIYLLRGNGELQRFSTDEGFRPIAQLPAPNNVELGGIAFDEDGNLFAVNGMDSFAFGRDVIEVSRILLPPTTGNPPPRARGLAFDPRTQAFVVSVERVGLIRFEGGSFTLLAPATAEPGGITPYEGGFMVGFKSGIVGQFTPEVGWCPELLLGARRTARLLRVLGRQVLVGDSFLPESPGIANARATLLTPSDLCLAAPGG